MQERQGQEKDRRTRDPPPPPSLKSPSGTLLTMARPKNPKTIFPTFHHHPNSRYFFHYFSITLFTSHHSHSLASPLLSNSLVKAPRRPALTSHHTNILLLFLFLLLTALSFLAFSKIPCLPTSPDSMVRRTGTTSPSESAVVPLPAHDISVNLTQEEREFWEQPDGWGYRPCIEFSLVYRQASARVTKERRRFVVAVVSGGLNQQRNQIVDAVVIARILGAALVVPVLKPNVVWGDRSAFEEIFDADHFKRVLRSDVHVVSSLPPSHRSRRPTVETSIPFNASPFWIRNRLGKKLNKDGILLLKGLDSKLSKDLPLDLQRLRCKVAFHALRFTAPIRELGDKLARRMWAGGAYVAVHLRLEKDVWVRTGCLPGLGPEYDRLVMDERRSHPELLTGQLNLAHDHRRLAGLCPLNALEVAALLRALGAPRSARVYWAGGEPLGGQQALRPLMAEFPKLTSKEILASDGELLKFANKSSVLAAVDFMVAMSSDVFMPSHGGNMARVIQGHRAYVGHKKSIRPNKRAVVQLLKQPAAAANSEGELRRMMKRVHAQQMGQPEERGRKKGRDVIAFPVPECMCRRRRLRFFF